MPDPNRQRSFSIRGAMPRSVYLAAINLPGDAARGNTRWRSGANTQVAHGRSWDYGLPGAGYTTSARVDGQAAQAAVGSCPWVWIRYMYPVGRTP